jgi:polysaccharide pyruvyl transferase WcaK-like protein
LHPPFLEASVTQWKGSHLLTIIQHRTAAEAPKIAAFGEWDTGNLGDQAIFEGVKDFFQSAGWLVNAYGLGSLAPIRQHLQASSPPSAPAEQWSATRSAGTTMHAWRTSAYAFLKPWMRPARQHLRIRRLLSEVAQARAVLVGGGALLSDEHLHFPQSLAAVGWAARKLHLPVFCLGCSAEGPWSTRGERMIAQFIRFCSVIATRDVATARRVAMIWGQPVPIFGDFAMSLRGVLTSHAPRRQVSRLAVNVMHLPHRWHADQQHYEDVLVHTIATWMRRYSLVSAVHVQIFTTGAGEDVVPARRVLARLSLPEASLYLPSALADLRGFLQAQTTVIASRLHAAILALVEGIPVIGLAVSPKIHEFLQTLGLQRYSVPVRDERVTWRLLDLIESSNVEPQPALLETAEISNSRAAIRSLLRQGTVRNGERDTSDEFVSVSQAFSPQPPTIGGWP